MLLKSSLKMFSLSCLITTSNVILIRWKVSEKMKPTGFALCWSCDPWQGQGQRKWCKMVEVNGAWHVWKNLVHKFACYVQCWSICHARPPASHLAIQTWYSYGYKKKGYRNKEDRQIHMSMNTFTSYLPPKNQNHNKQSHLPLSLSTNMTTADP